MTKTSLYIAAFALTLTACTSDEILGNPDQSADSGMAISFTPGVEKMQRADKTGSAAATALSNTFVVYGTKKKDATSECVFNHYTVNYVDGSANSTTSNTHGWEYVGQPLNTASTLAPGAEQEIKYWDTAADRYDFVAFSLGEKKSKQQKATGTIGDSEYPGTPSTGNVIVTPVQPAALITEAPALGDPTPTAYTLIGDVADLTKVYIADRITAADGAGTIANRRYHYKEPLQFAFKPLATTVSLGLFETIPGYSVTNVKFYNAADTDEPTATVPTLYNATEATIPYGMGTVNVSFPETNPAVPAYNKVKVAYADGSAKTQNLTLGTFTANTAAEQAENGGSVYLGRSSSTASQSEKAVMVPAPADALTLKIDFTLVSIDYNETIDIKGATATIPARFTDWQPNHDYTYLFKLSDAVTDAFGQQLLYPVQFDALEITDNFGLQQTITTVDQPSITTYAKGELTEGNKYYAGDHIYVAVMNGSVKQLDADNAKLYTVETSLDDELITEKNIIDNQNDLASFGITLNPVADDFMTFTNHIIADDSSTGDQIDAVVGSNFAKFTAAANTIYVFEYIESQPELYQNKEEYNLDHPDAQVDDDGWAMLTDSEKIKTPAGDSHYKVIRITDTPRPEP